MPADLVLNSRICLFWYMDDGGLVNTNGGQEIKLSTHGFLREELEKVLAPQLVAFSPRLQKETTTTGSEQFSIRIPRGKISKFLLFVGDCPVEELRYKWRFKPYKRPSLADPNFARTIKTLYANGLSKTDIAAQFGVSRGCVSYHLNAR